MICVCHTSHSHFCTMIDKSKCPHVFCLCPHICYSSSVYTKHVVALLGEFDTLSIPMLSSLQIFPTFISCVFQDLSIVLMASTEIWGFHVILGTFSY